MNLIEEYNKKYEFFRDIAGEAMRESYTLIIFWIIFL